MVVMFWIHWINNSNDGKEGENDYKLSSHNNSWIKYLSVTVLSLAWLTKAEGCPNSEQYP